MSRTTAQKQKEIHMKQPSFSSTHFYSIFIALYNFKSVVIPRVELSCKQIKLIEFNLFINITKLEAMNR